MSAETSTIDLSKDGSSTPEEEADKDKDSKDGKGN